MAEIRDLGERVDVTRGIRAGVGLVKDIHQIKRGERQEERAQETFDINKKAAEQDLEQKAVKEKERQENVLIDKLERRYEIAVQQKNFEAADRIRFELGQTSGIHLGGDHEELATLLSDRRKAVTDGNKEEIAAIDDYLSNVRKISPEEAAGVIGLTSEAEEFKAERVFGRKLEQQEQLAGVAEERESLRQTKAEQATAGALENIEGLDSTTKALLPLIASGKVSGAVLNQIASQTGVTFRTGMEGTGVNKGKSVTAVFDKSGKKVTEFAEAGIGEKAQRRIIESVDPLTGEKTVRGFVWSEDANGNPVIKIIVPEEPSVQVEEGVEGAPASQVKKLEDLKAKLGELGSSGELTPDAFLESITNIEELTEQEIIDAYQKALDIGGVVEEKESVQKERKIRKFIGEKLKGFPLFKTESKDRGA